MLSRNIEGNLFFIESSTLVISYVMRKERMTFKEAIAFIRKSRPKVLPNLGFERQLKKYE